MAKKYDIDTALKKEAIKNMKLWNGFMLGTIVTCVTAIGASAFIAIKAKLDADKRADNPSEFEDWIKSQIKDAPHVKMEDLEKENDDIIEDDDE